MNVPQDTVPQDTKNQPGWSEKPLGWEEVEVDNDYSHTNEDLEAINVTSYDALLALAGCMDDRGHCHEWVKRRLDIAYHIYKQSPSTIICLGGGTYHKPPYRNHLGFVVHESTACAEYLFHRGVKPQHIVKEWSSYDTIANAYFGLTNHIRPRRWTNLLIITSDFHMPRTKAIFEWIFSLDDRKYNLNFLSCTDGGLDPEIMDARREREAASLENLKITIKRITTLDQFHNWFYTEHKAYSCHFEERQLEIDEQTRRSY